jgi:ATP/maltotriose-dependent transcriptional regulator MalT/DNA-binding SARP family transcriptional activator
MPAMPSRAVARAVDTRRDASLPLAPPERPATSEPRPIRQPDGPERETDAAPDPRAPRRRPRLVVEGVRPALASDPATPGGHLGKMPEYPVQIGKVQAPPVREETLARDRLLEWLSIKIHRRVVLLVAEAGYGKTTLLADFTRRTRVRMLWFRLDRGDRDWVGFLAYLVAAIRVHAPDFGSATRALLRETATSAPPLDTVLDTFLRELGSVAGDASALVFDDFHLVDDSPEVRHIIRELLARGPDRLSLVFATRREPPIRLARLRAQGEVAELHTDDLRFDAAETEQLFRETYDIRIEPAMLAELNRRTEGWAASLQLVRSALNDRDPTQVRTFISSLSGAEGHLYDYLAEEVIGDLQPELQRFLMRTSLLETVDLVLAPIAADVSVNEARTYIEQAERRGLLGRGSTPGRHAVRAHPLVRDFLKSRLESSPLRDEVATIHWKIAIAAEPVDWNLAARHYLAADRPDEAERVLAHAIESILATGAYEAAQDIASGLVAGLGGTAGLILRSRLAQQRSAIAEALELAEEAWATEPSSSAALVNLATARMLAGDIAGALEAGRLLEVSASAEIAALARAFQRILETSLIGSLDAAHRELRDLAVVLRERKALHYLGVCLLNSALIQLARGNPQDALNDSDEAITSLVTSGAVNELVSARTARAGALVALGRLAEARTEGRNAWEAAPPGQLPEVVSDLARIEAFYGESQVGWEVIRRMSDELDPSSDTGGQLALTKAMLLIRDGEFEAGGRVWRDVAAGEPHSLAGFEAIRRLVGGYAQLMAGEEIAGAESVRSGVDLATAQGAWLWRDFGHALDALVTKSQGSSVVVTRLGNERPVVLSMLAEAVLPNLQDLEPEAQALVLMEAQRRPERWREPARRIVREWDSRIATGAADLLVSIGEPPDVALLGTVEKRDRSRGARRGYQLARRLAPKVVVEDLGRLRIIAGDRTIDGADVRRKVLALLCLLLSRSRFSATREEAIDSLWPDNDPASALNSLNQTVYFLRRVFEPHYVDETSPGYVGQDSETIWLDQELIESRSHRCLALIRDMAGDPSPEAALALANEYSGPFALDFAYEDWSVSFRDALHASYLRVIERAVRMDLNSGHFARGTYLAERAAGVEPDSEEIQVALVGLYKQQGAHAAAAEQYAHYAQSLKALGEEPLPISEI